MRKSSFRAAAALAALSLALPCPAVPFNTGTEDSTVVVNADGTGDYISLADAADAFTALPGGIHANWTVLIASSLNETRSACFGNTVPPDKTLTLRPAPGTYPNVNFTAYENPGGFDGGLMFGVTGTSSLDQVIATDNVILDGCNVPGGESRDLDMTWVSIRIVGGKNGILRNFTLRSSDVPAVRFTSRKTTSQEELVPTDWTVRNCRIEGWHWNARAIACDMSGTLASGTAQSGLLIDRNILSAGYYAILLSNNATTRITNNQIALDLEGGITHNGSNNASGWTITIAGNTFWRGNEETSPVDAWGAVAMDLSGGPALEGSKGTYDLYNNQLSNFDYYLNPWPPEAGDYVARGIKCSSANVDLFVRYNSINMNIESGPLTGATPGNMAGIICEPPFNGVCAIENNIINVTPANATAIYMASLAGTIRSNFNVFGPGAKVGHLGSTDFPTLPEWSAATGQDLASLWPFDPLTASGSRWAEGHPLNYTDLRFTPETVRPEGLYHAAPDPSITTDIEGQPRSTVAPYPGCDELLGPAVFPPPPTVTIGAPSVGSTNGVNPSSVDFPVSIGGAVEVRLDAPLYVRLVKTGTADATVAVSGTGLESRTITLTNITGEGTLAVAVRAGAARSDTGFSFDTPVSTAVQVVGDLPPALVCPPDVEAVTDAGVCSAQVTLSAEASDDKPGVQVIFSPESGEFPIGATGVTAYAVDSAGQQSPPCYFTVTVKDKEAPVIAPPADVTVGCSPEALVPVTFDTPAATDNCSAVDVVSVPASGSSFAVGETTVTVMATDAAGNTSTGTFTVTRAPLESAGFLAPIGGSSENGTGGSFEDPVRTFKLGSTIPLRFTLECGGAPVLTGVHTLQAIKYSSATTGETAIDPGSRFRLIAGEWRYNLKVSRSNGFSTGTWLLVATLSDGSHQSAWVRIY